VLAATDRFDLVVIGGGAAGEKGAARAAYFGKRVAVVERRDRPGGATVHTGTLPSKTLREAALFLSGYRQRDLYGISVEVAPQLEVAKLIERKNAVREQETERMLENLARHGIELIHGNARLVDPTTVEVTSDDGGTRRLTADAILITTGSRPFRPPGIPFDDPDVHDSDTILEIDRIPPSLTVLGGGVMGCEYASMFAVLGTDVHLVDPREQLLPFLDHEIVERLTDGMGSLGVTFHLGERADTVDRGDGCLRVHLASGGSIEAEQVLVTSGRVGTIAGLGLEELGVRTDERGRILVDETFRTTVPNVFAAGDVIGAPALATSSMEQARVAVSQAFGLAHDRYDARARGIDPVVGRARFRDNARGAIVGDRDGMTKLVFNRVDRRLVGVHCIGERATELVHLGQSVMLLGGTVETFVGMVFNYPSLSETYKYAAYDALGQLGDE
jgi:NAD(P) transhydrogenase